MNKIDLRFLEGTNLALADNKAGADVYAKVEDYKGQKVKVDKGWGDESVPVGTIAYSDGTRWIYTAPNENDVFYFEGRLWQYKNKSWCIVAHLSRFLSASFIIPTLIDFSETAPATCKTGDKYFNSATLKIHTATADNTWDEGEKLRKYCDYILGGYGYYSYEPDNGGLIKEQDINVPGTICAEIGYNGEGEKSFYILYGNTWYLLANPSQNELLASMARQGKTYTETHTLTAEDITAKGFTLSKSVATGEETNVLCFVSGVIQPVGIAFSMTNSTFYWTDKTLDGHVSAGDVVILQYYAVD